MPPKPADGPSRPPLNSTPTAESSATGAAKKRRQRRNNRKRRERRQSFAAPGDALESRDAIEEGDDEEVAEEGRRDTNESNSTHPSMYRLGKRATRSTESLDSEILLDHREHHVPRPRRPNTLATGTRSGARSGRSSSAMRKTKSYQTQHSNGAALDESSDDDDIEPTDRTPLITGSPVPPRPSSKKIQGYGGASGSHGTARYASRPRRPSDAQSRPMPPRQQSTTSFKDFDYDVNNPPSLPGSPRLGGDDDFDDVMLPEYRSRSPDRYNSNDAIIDIDAASSVQTPRAYVNSPYGSPNENMSQARRRQQQQRLEDVCVPFDQMTDIVEEEVLHHQHDRDESRAARAHKRQWPDLNALEEWSRDEKESRASDGVRAKKVNEPVLIDGRLRPRRGDWRREEEEAPFRWTYFNEELDSSLRSHTISGLQQLGMSFRELFIPDPPELDYSSSDEDEDEVQSLYRLPTRTLTPVPGGQSAATTRQSSMVEHQRTNPPFSQEKQASSGDHTPSQQQSAERPKKYGPRPVFWLDVLQPTYEEMRVISRTFGIHKLTAEDIMEQEAREKVELFRNYYFVNYRTFEQDEKNIEYMQPVNMYFIVFKGGVISFHFSQMPHPPNVRRRIRQLAEHQFTDSDWISYAIIDNITDAYAPLIEQIEEEVDDIDDAILRLHSRKDQSSEKKPNASKLRATRDAMGVYEKCANSDDDGDEDDSKPTIGDVGRDMLLRVGECRKRVMGLYRLLGNKADVIKGLAKRCNEQWQVAPRSDVGLYLGDIQDHIVTMTANLTHYENILSRAHSNYLAQINIGMNERAEQTADVLGKLTVLGTIVLPMNIVTGMWGMNCLVPGQDVDSLWWFFGITSFLMLFGVGCFFIAKKVYKIV